MKISDLTNLSLKFIVAKDVKYWGEFDKKSQIMISFNGNLIIQKMQKDSKV